MTTRSADLSYELNVLRELYGNLSLARIEASRLLGRLRARTEVLRCSKSALKRRKGVKTGNERSTSHLNTKEEYEQLRNWREEMKNIYILRESSLKFRRRECCAENDFIDTLWPHWDARSGGSLDDSVWKPEGYKSHYHGKIKEEWTDALLSSRVKRLVTAFTKWHTAISELQSARTMAVPFTISEGTRSEISHAVLVYVAKKKEENLPFKLNQAVVENKPHHILAEQCRRSLLDFVEEHAIEALFKIVEEEKCKIDGDHFESTSSQEENFKCTLMLLRGLHSLLTNEGKPSVTFLRQN
eukprot:222949_1